MRDEQANSGSSSSGVMQHTVSQGNILQSQPDLTGFGRYSGLPFPQDRSFQGLQHGSNRESFSNVGIQQGSNEDQQDVPFSDDNNFMYAKHFIFICI